MNLVKKTAFCIFFILPVYFSFSQEISIRGGLNLSQIELFEFDNVHYPLMKTGILFGPCFDFPVNQTLIVETGVLYTTKGFRHKHTDSDRTVTLAKLNVAYLELPMLLKMKIFSRNLILYGVGGGYYAPALFGRFNGKIEDEDHFKKTITWEKDGEFSLKRFDYGAKIGFDVQKDKLRIGIIYSLGFANLSYTEIPGYYRGAELIVGYQLFNGK